MKMGKHMGLILLVILGMSLLTRAQQHDQWPVYGSADVTLAHLPFLWPENKLQAGKITKQKLIALVDEIEKASEAQSGYDVGDVREEVESYTFTTLDSGPLYLVATTDAGSTWIQYINVVRCENHSCHMTTIHSEPEIDLNKQLLDLNKNGRHQILAEECVCPEAEREAGILPYVYEVSNNQVRDASAKYPEFFRSRLFPIPLDTPDELNTQEMIDEWNAELVFAQRDIERRVFGKRAAGLSDALQWELSKSTKIKFLAIDIFEKIDSPEAEAGLKRLSQSDSSYVRQRVQDALARKRVKLAH
jgi:hypothetical protein